MSLRYRMESCPRCGRAGSCAVDEENNPEHICDRCLQARASGKEQERTPLQIVTETLGDLIVTVSIALLILVAIWAPAREWFIKLGSLWQAVITLTAFIGVIRRRRAR